MLTAEQIKILTELLTREENRLVKLVKARIAQGRGDLGFDHLKKAVELREIKKTITAGEPAKTI